jgi:tRNA threonylcarbamoyladenosine biosynthesis protein TsaB
MAIVLCIETSTTNCSVSVIVDGKIVALKEDNENSYSHAERLHIYIEEVLKQAQVSKNKLQAIAVSKGPGSYTGLRIGVSAAKGLCFALDIPLISVPTLQSLALQVKEETDFVIPMLDARRMEVYVAVFDKNLLQIQNTKAEILDENSFTEFLNQGIVTFIGNANDKLQSIREHPNAVFLKEMLPSALEMAAIVEIKYKISDIENVAYFEPYYLKDFMTN